jgi:hypothetical protein
LALAAAAVAFAWPLTSALPPRLVISARLAAAVAAVLVCAALAIWNTAGQRFTILMSALCGLVGIALLAVHFDAQTRCIADYEGQPVIIGTTYTPEIQPYVQGNPGLSAADRLFDAGGVAERLWTTDSIRSCGLRVSWAGLGAIPFLAASAAALLRGRRYTLAARTPSPFSPATLGPTLPVFDAFVSYRHVEPDRTLAFELLETLEARALRVAIDARDFSPNEHFLSEMERCIRQSRFVLCVITSQYVQSDHTSEEAIISKTLDLAERRRRLVPLIFERVELPVWLHGLVGIDFTPGAIVDPRERLVQLLKGGPAAKPSEEERA